MDPPTVARSGPPAEKQRLADEDHLDDEVVDLLVLSGDTHVAAALATSSSVTTATLERLAELHPEHRRWIGSQPEVPVHLKDAVPVDDH
ncbi:hypothetical protein [Pseudokineococcus sp. 1T1Z-3]|uniref:hypothetical protein n=1 Tax=Pseudokineococcus sp. 1T1Z-3 TaxID=3132745 RepID=UPI0030A8AE35